MRPGEECGQSPSEVSVCIPITCVRFSADTDIDLRSDYISKHSSPRSFGSRGEISEQSFLLGPGTFSKGGQQIYDAFEYSGIRSQKEVRIAGKSFLLLSCAALLARSLVVHHQAMRAT